MVFHAAQDSRSSRDPLVTYTMADVEAIAPIPTGRYTLGEIANRLLCLAHNERTGNLIDSLSGWR